MNTNRFIIRSAPLSEEFTASANINAAPASANVPFAAFTRLGTKSNSTNTVKASKAEPGGKPLASKARFFATINAPMKDQSQDNRASHVRMLALTGLCALLVLSGAYAALGRNAAQMVDLPITVTRTQQPSLQPQATAEPAAASIEDIPMIAPADATLGSFSTYKVEMDAVRDQSIRMLDELIADANADAATVETARAEKLALAKAMTVEAELEGLTAARGYGESYFTVKPGSVNAVIRNPNLTNAQMASVVEMVTAQTGESADNVKIILTK
ncbi:MAG: SpoIIIAH-like family protein [Oscillospiraceae bacterium]|nr:SpoIIIAH-like family protein [Oscillospiraceae bacterium]